MKKTILLTCLILCLSLSVWATDKEEGTSENAKKEKMVPELFDVHERDAEMFRFELTPYFGSYLGDTLQDSFMAGGLLDFRLTPKLSVGVDFGWSRISVDPLSNFGSTVTNRNLYSIQGVLTYNMPAAFLSRKNVIETDFFTTVGGGIMRINNSTRGDGFIGGGMKIYTSFASWFGARVEVRGYFSTLSTPSGSDFTTDWTITLGPTFMLPPRLF